MATTWLPARALVWPTIKMITAVVMCTSLQIYARAALLLYTSRANVLTLTAISMMMKQALSLVET
jgi:hypothetical protein